MSKGNLIASLCGLLLVGWLGTAIADEGLILGFSADNVVSLTSVTSADQVPAPRSIPGSTWALVATSHDGAPRWARVLAAPREFHGNPDSAISFSAIVPAVVTGDLLSMTDAQGFVLWSRIVDDTLLVDAEKKARNLREQLDSAYKATAKLQRNDPKPGLVAAPDQEKRVSRQPRPHQDTIRESRSSISPKSTQAGPLYHVGGTVVVNNIDVRVFDAVTDDLIASLPTDWTNSRYDFDLPRGNYVFEVDDNRYRTDTPFFYRKPFRTAPIQIAANTELPAIPQRESAGQFVLQAQIPCSIIPTDPYSSTSVYLPTVTIISEDGTRIRRFRDRIGILRPEMIDGSGYCPVGYTLQATPGTYSMEIDIPGWETLHLDPVQIVDGETTQLEHLFELTDRTLVWNVQVVDDSDRPMINFRLRMIDETNEDGDGGVFNSEYGGPMTLKIAYSPGWIVEFEPFWSASNPTVARKRQVLGGQPLPSKVVLDATAVGNAMDSGLLRIVGDGVRQNRYNILFLADGYTDVHETFTDSNGNGVWDGIVWYDMDGDGHYDGAHDRYWIYGSEGYQNFPAPDPTSANEPFDDINNDGLLSIDEPAQFEQDARDFMRFFLGSDFWSEHKQAFNAYLLFEPSAESGFDITTESGQVVLERNTRYGANLIQPRLLMDANRQAAIDRALTVLPEVDMVVVLVNQAVYTFARANVTFAQPGVMVWPGGLSPRTTVDIGPSHEMGHFVGALCDEYAEFRAVSPLHGNPSTGCPNTSYLNDTKQVPWSNWILPGTTSPTRNLDGSVGIYEGAQYYAGGAYRPTWNSTMRFLSPLFNAPSRSALEMALHTRTGIWHDEADDAGRCARLPPTAIRRHDVTCQ